MPLTVADLAGQASEALSDARATRTMHRVVAHRFGPPREVLALERVPLPHLSADGALVRMLASPINPSDLIPVLGAYPHRTPLPFVPGYEGVGMVEAVGPSGDPTLIGRRVLPLGSAGSWQGWRSLASNWCIDVPEDLQDDQAALGYVNPLSARLMLEALAPRPGGRVGVSAAGSSIGRMLVRSLHRCGARPVAIVRSRRSALALAGEPVADVVVGDGPLPPLSAALDAVGGATGTRLAAAIRPGGMILHYGLLSGQSLDHGLLAKTGAVLRIFRLRDWVHSVPRQELRSAMASAFDDVRSGLAASAISGRFALPAFREALALEGRPSRQGKVILAMEG